MSSQDGARGAAGVAALDAGEVAALRRLLDRQAIVDCIRRYARGVDRGDVELVRSAYHDDALEDHGAYVGGLDGLVEFLGAAHAPFLGFQRYVTDSVVDVDGDEAHAESYYLCVLQRPAGPGGDGGRTERGGLLANGGRYVDRLARRDGEWRIVRRVVVVEWEGTVEGGAPRHPSNVEGRRDRSDVSYDRPLEVRSADRSP